MYQTFTQSPDPSKYTLTTVNIGEIVPGTSLRFTGANFAANSDDGYVIEPTFENIDTGTVVLYGQYSPYDELQNDRIIYQVTVDESVELKATAIVIGVPISQNGFKASRPFTRIHPLEP